MDSSRPKSKTWPPALSLTLFLLAHLLPSATAVTPLITYHDGPLLTGNLSLAVLWYGRFHSGEKKVIRAFIESLTTDRSLSFQPDVYAWWQKVESYATVANKAGSFGKKKKKIPTGGFVRIAREVYDENASAGKVLVDESIPGLLKEVTAGLANTVAVIFAAKDVTVLDTCDNLCYMNGVIGKQVYIAIGNPGEKCAAACGGPFHHSKVRGGPPAAVVLQSPNENVGLDSMIIHLASALAETVTNPFNSGFFGGEKGEYQAARACAGLYARGAFPGYPGNVRVDPNTGGAFNAHGLNGTKFLLPALWDPKTSNCWTTL